MRLPSLLTLSINCFKNIIDNSAVCFVMISWLGCLFYYTTKMMPLFSCPWRQRNEVVRGIKRDLGRKFTTTFWAFRCKSLSQGFRWNRNRRNKTLNSERMLCNRDGNGSAGHRSPNWRFFDGSVGSRVVCWLYVIHGWCPSDRGVCAGTRPTSVTYMYFLLDNTLGQAILFG